MKRTEPHLFVSASEIDIELHGNEVEKIFQRLAKRLTEIARTQFDVSVPRHQQVRRKRWPATISAGTETPLFLAPLVTPQYFNHQPCRLEWEKFWDIEMQSPDGFGDRVYPIYWREAAAFNDRKEGETWHANLRERKYIQDWRGIKSLDDTSKEDAVLTEFAERMVRAYEIFVPNSHALRDYQLSKLIVTDTEARSQYNSLEPKQKEILKHFYKEIHPEEVSVDDLFASLTHAKASNRMSLASEQELLFRMKDLEHRGFVYLHPAGDRTTKVIGGEATGDAVESAGIFRS